MGMICLKVPDDISKLFQNIEVPGKRDPSDHITMFYMGDEMSPNTIAKVCKVLPDVLEQTEPFDVVIKKITCFPGGDDGVPIKADIISKELEALRSKMAKVLDKNKISYSKKFPKFNPHLTLSYNNEEIKNIKLPTPIRWTVSNVFLWGGSISKNGINVDFPLHGKLSVKSILSLSDAFCKLATS